MNRSRRFMMLLYICGIVLYFFCNLQRSGVPGSLFNELQLDLSLSAGQVAGLGTAFIYTYTLNQLIAGYMTDRYGGMHVMMFGTFFFCAGGMFFPLVQSVWAAYAARALVGFGASFMYLGMVKFSGRLFPSIFPQMVGAVLLCGYMGNIAANAPLAWLSGQFTWRTTFLAAGVLATVFYALFLLLRMQVTPEPVCREPFSFRPVLEFLRKRHNIWICLFNGVNFPLYFILQTILGKKFLQDYCQISGGAAAMAMSVMAVTAAVSGMLAAILTRLIGNRRRIFFQAAAIYNVAAILISMAAICCNWRSPLLTGPLILLGLMSNFAPVNVALLYETNRRDLSGIAVSFSNFTSYLGVSVFGSLAGFLMEVTPPVWSGGMLVYSRTSYLAVFGLFLVLALISLLCVFPLKETYGKNIASQIR